MVGTYDNEDLAALATIVASSYAVLVVGITLARARRDILGSRVGWVLVAGSLAAMAARVLGHFVTTPSFQLFRHVAAILAMPLLPLGLFLILRGSRREEAIPPGA